MEQSEVECLQSVGQAYSLFQIRPASSIRGDFNRDGHGDWASLMDRKAPPAKAAIGVCLSGEPRPLLIPSEHGLTGIAMKAKGSRHNDLIKDMSGVFERDAISVNDGSGNRWSYILRAGTFARIADRD
ncbi:hypothetical protein [Cognatilysobacter bugurensis]|uniref:hypothetical protein n=1 Tax=Cognatilysobacter bugurensis TaxID=543356 RepID=UPI001674AB45|nr:hypothetical protein [Lysobacter bugurensis]